MSKKLKYDGYLPPDRARLIVDFQEGVKTSDPCRVDDLAPIFSWMRGFLNCFTGWANHGKTNLVMFLMLVKSVIDGTKWAIWSPEMIDTVKNDKGQMERSAHKLYNALVHAYTGKNPYKHKMNQMEVDEYNKALDFIQAHFYVLDTGPDKTPETLIKGFKSLHEAFGIYGWLVDPWKNIRLQNDLKETTDRVMEAAFDQFEELALSTDTVGNIIAHPKSMDETRMRKKGKLDGEYKVVSNHDLLGGSAWDNSMDGIFSYHRPERHLNPNSPKGGFYCLKQRSQELTHEPGEFKDIYFDKNSNRFYFSNVCPIDGSVRVPVQAEIDYVFERAKNRGKKPEAPPPPTVETPATGSDDLPF